ncbi:hypothetical protein K438DRAFT_1993685 [Mycena galopus ATCC 62051]|nr:hypothetical protein K438DRAFT_1993685 [Mycena galopus ATCC 62051]
MDFAAFRATGIAFNVRCLITGGVPILGLLVAWKGTMYGNGAMRIDAQVEGHVASAGSSAQNARCGYAEQYIMTSPQPINNLSLQVVVA